MTTEHRKTVIEDCKSRSQAGQQIRSNGVGTNFGVGGGTRGEARRAESRNGVLGRGQPAHPIQLGGLRERSKLPRAGTGAEPRPPKSFLVV